MPSPSPFNPDDENSPWWPYAILVSLIALFGMERAAVVNVLDKIIKSTPDDKPNQKEFYRQCLAFLCNESAFNMLVSALVGVARYYPQKWLLFTIIPFESALNLLAECYDAHVEGRDHKFKTILFNTSLPTTIASMAMGLSLFYLPPALEYLLWTTFAAQSLRQMVMLGTQYVTTKYSNSMNAIGVEEERIPLKKNADNHEHRPDKEPPDPPMGLDAVTVSTNAGADNYEEIPDFPIGRDSVTDNYGEDPDPLIDSASLWFNVARAAFAVGTTAAAVVTTAYLCDGAINNNVHYDTASGASLDAGVGGGVGLLATAAVGGIVVVSNYVLPKVSNCLYGMFARVRGYEVVGDSSPRSTNVNRSSP